MKSPGRIMDEKSNNKNLGSYISLFGSKLSSLF